MSSIEVLLLVALTCIVTFFVVLLSIALVVFKSFTATGAVIRGKLYTIYSNAVTDILLNEIPAEIVAGKPSDLFAHYDALLKPLKDDLTFDRKIYRTIKWETLKSVLLDYSQDLSGESRERLTYCFYSLGFVGEELYRVRSRRWWVRAQAVRSLGQYRVRKGMFALTEALDDPREEVRAQAVKSLIALVGPEALRVIFQRIKNVSRWLAIELSTEVMKYGEASVPYLLEALQSPDPTVLEFAIEMLAEVGFVDGVEPIRKIARAHRSITVQLKAIEALGRLGDARAELLLLQLTLDPDRRIRMKTIEALARIGAPGAAEFLLERMAEGDLEEKIAAATAISRSGEKGRRILDDLQSHGDPLFRSIADHVNDLTVATERA